MYRHQICSLESKRQKAFSLLRRIKVISESLDNHKARKHFRSKTDFVYQSNMRSQGPN